MYPYITLLLKGFFLLLSLDIINFILKLKMDSWQVPVFTGDCIRDHLYDIQKNKPVFCHLKSSNHPIPNFVAFGILYLLSTAVTVFAKPKKCKLLTFWVL